MFVIDLSNPVGMRDRAIFGILAYTIMRDGAVGRFDITDYYRSWQAEGVLPREGFDQEGHSGKGSRTRDDTFTTEKEALLEFLAEYGMFLAKTITGFYSGFMLDRFVPAEGPQSPGTLWLIYGLIALLSPIGLILARRWLIAGVRNEGVG